MIPTSSEMAEDFETEYELQPSKTYKLQANGTISGVIDEIEAMEQAVYKILNTERFNYMIYSWDYGIELDELIGESIMFVIPELERRIEEALMQDERITDIEDFEFELLGGAVFVSFTVHTIFGDIDAEKEVVY